MEAVELLTRHPSPCLAGLVQENLRKAVQTLEDIPGHVEGIVQGIADTAASDPLESFQNSGCLDLDSFLGWAAS